MGMIRGVKDPKDFCPHLYVLAAYFADPLQRRLQAERMRSSRVVDDCRFTSALCGLDPTLQRLMIFFEEACMTSDPVTSQNKKWIMMADDKEKLTLWHRAQREGVRCKIF
jgi:hypothetical protein